MIGAPLIMLQCPDTKGCRNERCFWWQRDNAGLNPFPAAEIYAGTYQGGEIAAKHGEPYFPELRVSVGTNCLNVSCPDRTDKEADRKGVPVRDDDGNYLGIVYRKENP